MSIFFPVGIPSTSSYAVSASISYEVNSPLVTANLAIQGMFGNRGPRGTPLTGCPAGYYDATIDNPPFVKVTPTARDYFLCFPIPTTTPTPSLTPTRTTTVTPTITPTPTPSITITSTVTPSVTPTITPTNTVTPTVTSTRTPTVTPTITPTTTATPTNTSTVTPTITPTNTVTPTITPSVTSTLTPTNTVTPTITPTITPTVTTTITPTTTVTPTNTSTVTPSVTVTPTNTVTPTITPSVTPSVTPTVQCPCTELQGTFQWGYTLSGYCSSPSTQNFSRDCNNRYYLGSGCVSVFPSTNLSDVGVLLSQSVLYTVTNGFLTGTTVCPSNTPTPTTTVTPTNTVTPTRTVTPTNTITPTITPSITPTITPTITFTPTLTPSRTQTPPASPPVSPPVTPTVTPTPPVTPPVTPTVTPTPPVTPTVTPTPPVSPSVSPPVTPTVTPTPSITPSKPRYIITLSASEDAIGGTTLSISQTSPATVTVSNLSFYAYSNQSDCTGNQIPDYVDMNFSISVSQGNINNSRNNGSDYSSGSPYYIFISSATVDTSDGNGGITRTSGQQWTDSNGYQWQFVADALNNCSPLAYI